MIAATFLFSLMAVVATGMVFYGLIRGRVLHDMRWVKRAESAPVYWLAMATYAFLIAVALYALKDIHS